MRILLFVISTFLVSTVISAQDTIIKKNGDRIDGKVLEVKKGYVSFLKSGSDEIDWIFTAEIKEVIRAESEKDAELSVHSDIIITKKGDIMEVEIGTISEEYVEYKEVKDGKITERKIHRDNVKEVLKKPVFDKKYYEEPEEKVIIKNLTELQDVHRNHIKTSFSGLLNGSLIVAYERTLNIRLRAEVSFKTHGIGLTSNNIEKNGVGLEVGVKYKLRPTLENEDMYDSHYLHGAYIKASIGGSSVNEQVENQNSEFKFENVNRDYFHGGVSLGYQWVFDNRFTVDAHMGLNYFNGSFESTINQNGEIVTTEVKEFEDGDLFGEGNLGVSAGLNLGYLFSVKR